MEESALFFHVSGTVPGGAKVLPWQVKSAEEHGLVKERSATSDLCAKAKMRIETLFVDASNETGEGLPAQVLSDIDAVINGGHKTFRYMLFTGLLAAVTDKTLHPRCLQAQAPVEGAFDARSLCQHVVVPFEKTFLRGRLGASGEPYANKPARFAMIDLTNNVRKGADTAALRHLYDVLEFVRLAPDDIRTKAFCFALKLILQRPPNAATVLVTAPVNSSHLDHERFFDFLGAHTGGVSAVATLAAYFRMFYFKTARVDVHPANESGASSREVGDIDLVLASDKRYAVEVKDKPFSDIDVQHACERTLSAGVGKLVFALGIAAERSRYHEHALVETWAEKGLELTFLRIQEVLGVALCIVDGEGRRDFANGIYRALAEMNAPDSVMAKFKQAFEDGT